MVPSDEANAPRAKVPLPESITMEERLGSLRLVRRWFSGRVLLMAVFCVFWDGFLVFWYTRPEMPFFAKLFPILHLAVGVGLTYGTLAGFVNRTVIDVGQGQLAIWHGPLPWLGGRRLPATDLAQIFCEEKVGGENSPTTYRLSAVRRDGRKVKLLSGLPEADQALYLEQQIESRLGLRDQRVGGELPR